MSISYGEKVLNWLRAHLLGTVVVSFGVGAALTTLVVGVPGLTSSEVAGWSSAVGTLAAVAVALYLAGVECRQRRIDKASASRLAYVTLWPRFHRAQALVGDITFELLNDVAPFEDRQEKLAEVIDALERDLAAISSLSGAFDQGIAERVSGAVALAGYVARQAKRVAKPTWRGAPIDLWGSPIRKEWLKDSRLANQLLLDLSTETKNIANEITGRKDPTYKKDY